MSNIFVEVDLKGAPLDSFSVEDVNGAYGVLLRNAADFTTEDYENFALKFGKPLKYVDSPRWVFEEVYNEAELHYDGISAVSQDLVPEYLFFYVENSQETVAKGGEFLLMDCVGALEALPQDMVEYLRHHKQNFYGYPLYNKPQPAADELTFSIDTITSYNGVDRLRFHLPFDRVKITDHKTPLVYSIPHDFSMLIEGLSAQETLDFMNEMQKLLMTDDLLWKLVFQKDDVLIVDNELAFHGRFSTSVKSSRLVHRIQTLHD